MSLTKVTYSMISGASINVLDYGADPTGVSNSTAAITAAITAAPNNGQIIFPAGTYLVVPATDVVYNDLSSVTRKTAFEISNKNNLSFTSEGHVNIVVGGTAPERVAFYFNNCDNITFQNIGFNLANTQISEPGTTYLTTEDFIPIAMSGCDGVTIQGCKFVACRTAVFADDFNGSGNANIQVINSTFREVCNYSLITRKANSVLFSNNFCFATGRSWNTDNEDCAFSNLTAQAQAIGNQFISPIGTVSRITAAKNTGPTIVSNNIKNGKGIFFEAYEASNGVVSNNTSVNFVDTAEHFLFTADSNTGGENWVISSNYFRGGGFCISDYFSGTHVKNGLTVTGNSFINCYGPVASAPRSSVVVTGNHFQLNNSGQLIYFSGDGTIFSNNKVQNGYLKIYSDNTSNGWSITGNRFDGNSTPIPYVFDISGTVNHFIENNSLSGGYSAWFNTSPALRFGFKYTDVGFSTSPETAGSTYLTTSVGDKAINISPVSGGYIGWVCTTAGIPGTWKTYGLIS